MRLISLTANKEEFKPIYFNRSGITLILGKQKSRGASEKGKTYNGVGKSLAIALIHFCLGSNKNSEYERAIPEWEFTLEFEIAGQRMTSRRKTSAQNRIYLNDEEMGVKKFTELLEAKVFQLPSSRPYITFRSLLSRFLRPRKASYVTFDSAEPREKPYERLLRNAFLLGLDVDLVDKKRNLTVERDKIREFRGNLEKDTIFREFFTGFKDVEIELIDLDEKVVALERDISSFKIAENYQQVQLLANAVRGDLQQYRNRVVVIRNAINNIERSLNVKVDIPIDRVAQVYKEAATALPDSTIKTIEEVVAFHQQLMANRVKRLSAERSRLETEQGGIEKHIGRLNNELNEKLRFLSEHGALEEYARMTNLVGDLRAKVRKLRDYKELLAKYADQIREINASLVHESEKASKYIEQASGLLNSNLSLFRSFSRRFYPDKPGGLTVVNNEGDNQVRFDIHARIQDDASDGINEVKIFCFDMTVLTARHNHYVNFLFHDSRLFSDIDHRQRATLFRIAAKEAREREIQYIATVNEDQIVSMQDQFTEEEYASIFTKNVVLELTDESPSEKLLGIEVDMHYE